MPDRFLSRAACFDTTAIGKSTSARRLHSRGIIARPVGRLLGRVAEADRPRQGVYRQIVVRDLLDLMPIERCRVSDRRLQYAESAQLVTT